MKVAPSGKSAVSNPFGKDFTKSLSCTPSNAHLKLFSGIFFVLKHMFSARVPSNGVSP
jgi:hypothetical protein